MKRTFEDVRAALVRSKDGVGRPYPEAARRAVVALVGHKRAEGVELARVAAGLGVSATTLRKWMREEAAPADFREVEILASPPAPSGLVIHGPRGMRIEGATIADVAELFRRLG
jgi:hypothetical protein